MTIKKYLILIIICFLLSAYSVDADVMESQNYRLESDEINMGAIGEMRNFSGLSQQEKELGLATNQNSKQGPVIVFIREASVWEIIFGSALVLVILVFVYRVIFKKRLFAKQ